MLPMSIPCSRRVTRTSVTDSRRPPLTPPASCSARGGLASRVLSRSASLVSTLLEFEQTRSDQIEGCGLGSERDRRRMHTIRVRRFAWASAAGSHWSTCPIRGQRSRIWMRIYESAVGASPRLRAVGPRTSPKSGWWEALTRAYSASSSTGARSSGGNQVRSSSCDSIAATDEPTRRVPLRMCESGSIV